MKTALFTDDEFTEAAGKGSLLRLRKMLPREQEHAVISGQSFELCNFGSQQLLPEIQASYRRDIAGSDQFRLDHELLSHAIFRPAAK